MDAKLKYRNRIVTDEDIALIQSLITEHPADSRRQLSKRLCQAWNWVQANGELRDMVCRSLLLQLERAGQIQLPPKRCSPNNPLVRRKKPDRPSLDQTPIEVDLCRLPELVIRQVRRLPQERLFNALVEHHHYLGYRQPVGEHLKHLILMGERPIAGENLEDLLSRRLAQLPPPIRICDALSRNLPGTVKTILANCLIHGRRNFIDTIPAFPQTSRNALGRPDDGQRVVELREPPALLGGDRASALCKFGRGSRAVKAFGSGGNSH
ncbi:MAG TPA: DUF4338 domain-containing protein [Syntrophobacteraceae bacterium]|nr:DUF4338 domain-containing protein [Syntrophobacteraceae bacterium]